MVAALYWFQPWRLVSDREVREALPPVAPVATSAAVPPADPVATPAPATAPPADTARRVAAGEFVSHEHDTSGRVELIRRPGGAHQLLFRDLETSDGPDLRVWLTDREVLPGRDGWRVFDDGRWVELARLKGNRGDQVYAVPGEVDIERLRSVTIWCKRFSVSFGAAALITA